MAEIARQREKAHESIDRLIRPHDIALACKDAGDKAFKDANPAHPIHRADAFRYLTQNLGQAFDLALETKDPEYPQIHYFTTPSMKLGGDVCDDGGLDSQAFLLSQHRTANG